MLDKFYGEIESLDKQLEMARERVEASEGTAEEVEELIRSREKAMEYLARAKQPIKSGEGTSMVSMHKGFIIEIVQPACRGREVWPSLAMILPIAGVIGTLLGLAFGGWVSLAFKAS